MTAARLKRRGINDGLYQPTELMTVEPIAGL